MYITIPTYDIPTKKWDEKPFSRKEDYHAFVLSHFKFPGKYNLKQTEVWREKKTFFEKNKGYCPYKSGTLDFIKFWDFEKLKSYNWGGVIYYTGEQEFFIPGDYYFYLNYCPIFDKVKNQQAFPDVWDSDLHCYIYTLLCRLEGMHNLTLKKRQWGATYKYDEVLINSLWFGDHSLHKVFTANNNQLDGTWAYLEHYKNHLNSHTGWVRPMNPGGHLGWTTRMEIKKPDGQWVWIGPHCELNGFVTEKDPSSPVGGGGVVVFGDEAGKNNSLDKTHGYLLPVVQMGGMTTGLIIYSGAVGELDKCEPLKKYFYNPAAGRFRPIENVWDEELIGTPCGFFVPASWNYIDEGGKRYYDADGNSSVEEAKVVIEALMEQKRLTETPEDYQLFVSQNPLTPAQAFDYRQEAIFPLGIINKQVSRLEREKDRQGQPVEILNDGNGNLSHKFSTKKPISVFPLTKTDIAGKGINKEGCVVMWKPPDHSLPFGTYYAGVDTVEEQSSTTSESLCCIYIVKAASEKTKVKQKQKTIEITSWEICACWIGRFEDPKKNHEMCEILLEYYNARALVEINVDTFIRYMLGRKKLKYLVPTDEIKFRPEIGGVKKPQSYKWGFKTTTDVKNVIIHNLIEVVKDEIGTLAMSTGKELRKIYGVERIPDIMLLKEMKAYDGKINVDRLIAFGAVISHIIILEKSGYVAKSTEEEKVEDIGQQQQSARPPQRTPFANLGNQNRHQGQQHPRRSPFKNIR